MDRHPLVKCGCDWQNGPDGKCFSSSSSRTSNKYIDVACLGTDQNYRIPLKPSKTLQRTNHLGFLGGSKSLSDWPNWP